MPVRAKVVSLLAMWAGVALVARSEGTVGPWSLAVACLAAIGSAVLLFGVRSAALPRVEPEAERG